MKKPLLKMLAIMVGIICLTVGAGFAVGTPAPGADAVVILKTSGMTCGSCAARIDAALKEVQGIETVQVDVASGKMLAAYRSDTVTPEAVVEAVTRTGYPSTVMAVLTMDQYKAAVSSSNAMGSAPQGGCGGDCCNKNRK